MKAAIPADKMFTDPETGNKGTAMEHYVRSYAQKKFAAEAEKNADAPQSKPLVEAKVFCVVVTSTKATRWMQHDDVLVQGVEARMRLYFEHLTEGQLPGVQVTLSKGGAS